MTAPSTHTLAVPGAELAYDVRAGTGDGGAALLLVGSPRAASGFGTLAGYLADRTVVTDDPRGSERSRAEPTGRSARSVGSVGSAGGQSSRACRPRLCRPLGSSRSAIAATASAYPLA